MHLLAAAPRTATTTVIIPMVPTAPAGVSFPATWRYIKEREREREREKEREREREIERERKREREGHLPMNHL